MSIEMKYFHLDLKGAPPKISFLKALWPLLKKWGITGVLIEWEDCFPYSDNLAFLWNQVYRIEEARVIIQDMQDAKLEVIPLVQTFGHLEFVLKHKDLVPLREFPIYPSSLCPSHPHSLGLVSSLVDQIVEFHGGGLRHLHIGADEVWHMGMCERCQMRITAGETRQDLFLKFVKLALEQIKKKWNNLDIIMWDDMLRPMDTPILLGSGITSLVQPMVWHYNSEETFSLPMDLWTKYELFESVWAAGAFKGASGGSQIVTPPAHHLGNTVQWMRCLKDNKIQVKGFVLTGWSRYDHFASLCETIPSGLPTLGLCLRALLGKDVAAASEMLAIVESELAPSTTENKNRTPEEDCLLASLQVYQLTIELRELRMMAQNILHGQELQTWMNDWQVKNKRVNPMQIIPISFAMKSTMDNLIKIEISLRQYMSVIFHQSTVEEFLCTYITPLQEKLRIQHTIAGDIIADASSSSHIQNIEMDL